MQSNKIKAVLSWPTPHNVKGVRGFLGLIGYYCKFIQGYDNIAKPLTELTKKCNFQWGQEAQVAFEQLKEAIVTTPVLRLPNFSQPFEIECDASGKGIGTVLMQKRHPIANFSKALSEWNLAKSAYEWEIMALALAVQHWRPYLLGRQFKVFSDQKSLHYLQQRITTLDQQNWVAKLLGYNFEIFYKPSKENREVNALSRREEGAYSSIASYPAWEEGNQLLQETNQDPTLQKIKIDLQNNPLSRPVFALQNNICITKGDWYSLRP